MEKKRALILYATMTRNTEKIATVFRDTLLYYGWDVTFHKLLPPAKMVQYQEELYFDDYDLIALGSPIVGGMPLQNVINNLSMGGGGKLEKAVQTKLDTAGPGQETAAAAEAPAMTNVMWRRYSAPYRGVLRRGDKRPYGIVFCTYGGGFYGPSECLPVLNMLRLYLESANVDIIGQFACPGKETGPAGFDLGVKPPRDFRPGPAGKNAPLADVPDAIDYPFSDGHTQKGAYFFHYDLNNKPDERELKKAEYFICDIIEDFFMTYDGVPNMPISEIISIS